MILASKTGHVFHEVIPLNHCTLLEDLIISPRSGNLLHGGEVKIGSRSYVPINRNVTDGAGAMGKTMLN